MTCELITGSAGVEHVSSADDGSMFASVFGDGRYAVHQGDDLTATMGSANSITIATGAGFMDGRYWRITSAETVTVDSGAQGVNRIDLVGIRYYLNNGTGVETCTLTVVKGTAVAGTPSVPTYADGNILNGATEAFFPLYSITLTGITPGTPVALFDFMGGTVNCPWPVGAVLQMTQSTDPNNIYPGTSWSKIQGMFLLGSSGSYTLGSTGGAATVTLSAANLPAHTHTYDKADATSGGTSLSVAQLPAVSGSVKFRRTHVNNGNLFAEASGVISTGSGTFSSAYDKVTQYDGSATSAETLNISFGSGSAHSHSVSATSTASGSVGSGTAVNKMPPYKVVNIWERVA